MKANLGLWIDHRKAVIVMTSDEEEETIVVESHANRNPSRQDGLPGTEPFESLKMQADDVAERKFEQQLNAFYDQVIDIIQDAKSILIFGPGEAKGELAKRLTFKSPGKRTVNMETTDKMTNRQIAAHIRECFESERPVIVLG